MQPMSTCRLVADGDCRIIAIPKVLSHVGINKDDVDIYEINEAFGSQLAYCVRELGIPKEKVVYMLAVT